MLFVLQNSYSGEWLFNSDSLSDALLLATVYNYSKGLRMACSRTAPECYFSTQITVIDGAPYFKAPLQLKLRNSRCCHEHTVYWYDRLPAHLIIECTQIGGAWTRREERCAHRNPGPQKQHASAQSLDGGWSKLATGWFLD